MKKIIVLSFAVIAIALGFAFFATPANAVGTGVACTTVADANGVITKCTTPGDACIDGICKANADTYGLNTIENTVTLGKKSLTETVAQLINVALSLLGIIAVVIILVGGFKWMTAGGNEDKVGEAKKMIISGVIGLAIIMSAFAIAQFVIKSLASQTGADQNQALPEGLIQ